MTDLSPEAAADLTASALARAYLTGDADPVAVTEVCLARIEAARDAAVFLAVTADRARSEAKAAKARYEAGRPASALDGVPVAWKDLVDMDGEVTTAASALFRHAPPAEADAPIVSHLTAAGMVSLGKVNLTEFAYSGLGLNPHYGTPVNPCDQEVARAPGGSSSGSAVAVAGGLAPIAIGSDTGGSVRVPAAFNGVVGAKSSEGRIDTRSVIPLAPSLDTIGPLCRSVEDAVLIDAALTGSTPTVRRAAITDLELVVCESVFFEDCEDDVASAFEAAVKRLEKAGAKVSWKRFAEVEEVSAITAEHGALAGAEAYHYHRERVDGPDVEEMDGRVVARILIGKRMSANSLLTIQHARKRLAARIASTLDGALMIGPTVPHVAPEIAPLDADPELFHKMNLRTLRNTMIGNFLNMPGVALPIGTSRLPTSLQVAAPANEDERVLGAAWAMETTVRGD
ncbi:MAG: amidase [Pseudomonadota bacterium]